MGEAYPGSTGGEIFNYYGTDSNTNVASGTYSTASGYNNKALGNYSFVVGVNNTTGGEGLYSGGTGTFIAGHDNSNVRGIVLGYNNQPGFTNSGTDRIFIGDSLRGVRKHGTYSETNSLIILGKLNETELHLEGNDGVVVVGCGKNNNRKTALEINNTECKILNNLQLASDTTHVNAITPPQDPDNVTADDMTLVTKSYTRGITVPRAEILLTGQSTSLVVGQAVNLVTDLSLTIPTWAKQIRFGIHNSGGYVEYLLVDNISSHSYVSVTGAGTVDVYNYNPSTNDFSFVSGGSSMSIVSVRAEGTTTI